MLGTRVPFSRGETAIWGSTGSTNSFIVVIPTMLVASFLANQRQCPPPTNAHFLSYIGTRHYRLFSLHCLFVWLNDIVIVCLVIVCVTVFSLLFLCACEFLWCVIWIVGPVEQRSVSGTWWTEEGSGFGIKPHDLAAPSPCSKCHLLAENLFRPPPPSTSVWATY